MVQRLIEIVSHEDAGQLDVGFVVDQVTDPDLANPSEGVFVPTVLEAESLYSLIDESGDPVFGSLVEESDLVVLNSADIKNTLGIPIEVSGGLLDYDPSGLVVEGKNVSDPAERFAYVGVPPKFQVTSLFSETSIASSNPGNNVLFASDDPAFELVDSWSVSFWLRVASVSDQIPLVGKGINVSGEEGWSIGTAFSGGTSGRLWAETEQITGGMGSSAYALWNFSNFQYQSSVWSHHVFVFDFDSGVPPTFVQYKNGGAAQSGPSYTGTFSPTRTNNNQNFSVFGGTGFYSSSNYPVQVNMIDLCIYKGTILTQADAALLYNGGTVLPPVSVVGLTAPPDIYYTLRNISSGLTDLQGNAPNLINSGCGDSTLFP